MNGYYFVLVEYNGGRCGYSDARYASEKAAERRARLIRKKEGVRSAKVRYQYGVMPVDIKNFV